MPHQEQALYFTLNIIFERCGMEIKKLLRRRKEIVLKRMCGK
jgi:hypothetical protein